MEPGTRPTGPSIAMSATASGASPTGAPSAAGAARVFSWNDGFGKLGVQSLTRDKAAALAVSLT